MSLGQPLCLGIHALQCFGSGDRIRRHNQLRNEFHTKASLAMCSPVTEKPGLVIGTKERPADVFLPQFSRGKDYFLDFAVTNPLSDYMIQQSRASSKDACVIYADLKINKYNNNIKNPLNVTFQPMIVDAFGKWETTEKEVIHIVAARLASRNNTDIVSTHRHFHQKLSVILQLLDQYSVES